MKETKMTTCRALWASVATAAVLIVLTFCALVAPFDVNPYFELNRPEEAALEIQRCALGRPYSCL